MSLERFPLHAIAHGRAGDKGSTSNISVIAYDKLHWPVLVDQVTVDVVREVFGHLNPGNITRYTLPNLMALNFVLEDVLQGGVNASLNIDRHGKSLSFLLLGDCHVLIDAETLPPASPYRLKRETQ